MYCNRFMARSSVSMKTIFGCLLELAGATGAAFWTAAAGAGEFAGAGCAPVSDGAFGCPKLASCALQAATSFGSTCGRGLLALCLWAVPCMIGSMQSSHTPLPALTPPCTKPAFMQALLICWQGPWAKAV